MSRKNNNKILIMAGGTGGHIFPALSIAECLLSKGLQVEWLGTRNSMEARVIGETDIPIHFISISGLRGKSLWRKILSPIFIAYAVIQSMVKLISIKPDCVLGMGGFVTGPGGLASWLLRKKLLIHEQNAIAGFSNQMLFPFASIVMEAFPGAFERKQNITKSALLRSMIKSEKAIQVGNPVRAEFSNCLEPAQRYAESNPDNKLKILVIGGSLGAVAINNTLPVFLAMFAKDGRPEVIHQCGKNNLDQTIQTYSDNKVELNDTVRVQPFITDMAKSYCWADIIICRAGAITISEIASVGIPSVLIPFPYAVDDHQTENAQVLQRNNAAWVIPQDQLSAESLYTLIDSVNKDRPRLLQMALAAKSSANDSGAETAAELCMEACYA